MKAIQTIHHDSLLQGDPNPACYALLQAIDSRRPWREELINLEEKAEKIIKMWDIRAYKKLVHIFPHIIPKKYHDQMPIIRMDDRMEWVLEYPTKI